MVNQLVKRSGNRQRRLQIDGQSSMNWPDRLEQLLLQNELLQQRQQSRARYCPDLSYGRHFAPPVPSARPAAVMILLEQPEPGAHWSRCTIPLTVRPDDLADHPGQISLPGGRLENVETYQEAATREFQEELGLDRFPGRVLGELLPLWVFNSNYRLRPFLAVHAGRLDYSPCQREVARLIHLPVAQLLLESTTVTHDVFSRGSVRWKAGVIRYQCDQIWGATAIILAELAALLRGV